MSGVSTSEPLLIAGAGVSGLALASFFNRQGARVVVLERKETVTEGAGGVTLWPNALAALDALGLGSRIRDSGVAVRSGGFRRWSGVSLMDVPAPRLSDALGGELLGVTRRSLLQRMLEAAEGVDLRMRAEVTDYEADAAGVSVTLADGTRLRGRALLACDGIGSLAARRLGSISFRYAGYCAWRGVARLPLAAGEAVTSWGGGSEFGYVPLSDGRVYWFATVRAPEHVDPADRDGELRSFESWHYPIPELVEATDRAELVRHNIYDRKTPRRWAVGPVALVGDAAHPMRPNLGQGGCQALEDAALLSKCLCRHPPAVAFGSYERLRRGRVSMVTGWSRRLAQLSCQAGLRGVVRDASVAAMPATRSLSLFSAIAGYRAFGEQLARLEGEERRSAL